MIKKFFTYPVFVILFLSIIVSILFGSILRHHYLGGDRLVTLQKIAVFFAEIPSRSRHIIKYRTLDLDKPAKLKKHINKKKFQGDKIINRNALLILPKYDHSINRSVIDVIDLNNFKTIHTYSHDINNMNSKVINKEEHPRIKIDHSPTRFLYDHPLIFSDGSVTSMYGPLYKIDFCSNLIWINDENIFHHSQMLDHENNIWIGGQMNPKSKYIEKFSINNYYDDSIIKINESGKILFNKSVTEILIENNILPENFALTWSLGEADPIHKTGREDPIHLNDIEPALSSSAYWKKGDLFLSPRNQNSIIHYRPSTNKVINYITGPFARQHDIDIISDKEITIFNNNEFFVNNNYSEVLIYNFETKKFRKLFNNEIMNSNFKTNKAGLSHLFKDGSLMIEESVHGRIILLNNQGEKEWEFINKDKNGDIGRLNRSRIIEDEILINKFKSIINNKKC